MKDLNTQASKAFPQTQPLYRKDFESFKQYIGTILENFGITEHEFNFIGSFPKKDVVRDVDIAILCTYESFIKNFDTSESTKVKFIPGFKQVSIEVEFNNQLVQVDFMCVTSLEWAEFIYNPCIGSKYKGLYRNLLLQAIMKAYTYYEYRDNKTFSQMVFYYHSGVYAVSKSNYSVKTGARIKRPTLVSSGFVTNNPKEFLKMFDLHNIDTFEELFSEVRTRTRFNQIVENMRENCKEIGLEVPSELTSLNNLN